MGRALQTEERPCPGEPTDPTSSSGAGWNMGADPWQGEGGMELKDMHMHPVLQVDVSTRVCIGVGGVGGVAVVFPWYLLQSHL